MAKNGNNNISGGLAYVKATLPEINLLEDREIADKVADLVKAWRESSWE